MNRSVALLSGLALALIVGCGSHPASSKAKVAKEKVGIYDSRAIAIAYVGSSYCRASMNDLVARHDKAKAEGDEQTVKATDEEGIERQRKAHLQGFSTAPVDEILALVQDQLPAIAKKAGVGPLVSKWDTETLAKYADAEQVDVTMALVDAFKPEQSLRKTAIEVQKIEPVPLEEADKMPANE